MAFSGVLHQALLLAVLSLRASRSEVLGEHFPLTPEILAVSTQSKLQQVNLQWTIANLTHQELKMVFQIEISRITTSNIIWVENYKTTVKWTETLHWSWKSEIPLECVTHFIRIRAMVDDVQDLPQSSWSNWTSWKEVREQVSVKPDALLIFPENKHLEEGSNVTFCVMYGQYIHDVSCDFPDNSIYEELDSYVSLVKLSNVVFHSSGGTNIACKAMNATEKALGTVLFVSKVLEEPKNFSCETEDFRTLKCSWEPGVDTSLGFARRLHFFQNYTLYESISGRLEHSHHRNSHNWRITDKSQETYNFTLTAENNLRRRSVNTIFNLTHRVHLRAPHKVTAETIGATQANMTWKVYSRGDNYTFLCQVELQCKREVMRHNVSVHMNANYLLSDLQPDTTYTARVRCADAKHFWKWSDWTQTEFCTPKAAPSQALDVWRQVEPKNGNHVVTLFWKPLSKSQANGKITFYTIVVENQDKPTESKHYSIRAPALSAKLNLDPHSYKIRITANNDVGASPESAIVLANDSGHEVVLEKRIKGTEDGIRISWEPLSGDAMGYVVDWYAHSRDQHYDLQWKHLGPNTTSTFITSDAFKPGVRYNFRIFEISKQQVARLIEKQTGYTQELAPLENPTVHINYLTSNSFVLSWPDYASDFQSGYIEGYRVNLKSKEMECLPEGNKTILADSVLCTYDIKDPKTKTFTVENLQPETLYEFFVASYTSAGMGPSEAFRKVTTSDDLRHRLLQIILPMTLFVLLIIFMFYWKGQWVKEKCYPDFPNPYKSSILSLIKSKKNPHLIMNVKDCIPDVLEVINKAEGSKTQCGGSGKPHTEDTSTTPPSMPTEDSSGPIPCIFLENFTYDQSAFDSDSHGLIPASLKDTPCQFQLLIPPDKLLNVLEKDYMKPLESPTEETSLIYVSQLASPMCGNKDSLATNPAMPVHCSEYKMQMAVPGNLSSPAE